MNNRLNSERSMKIVTGLGSIDDYPEFVTAGADELFGGYQPLDYMTLYGRTNPINRREVIYYNVQLGSESELRILRKMISERGAEVSLAFNALSFSDETRNYVRDVILRCRDWGFKRFIVADYDLIKLLEPYDILIEVSGELGELNYGAMEALAQNNISRIIFPRQTTIREMAEIIRRSPMKGIEYEAFVLNEKCHYTGAYCNSVHCDELCHMCRVPYRLYKYGPVNMNMMAEEVPDEAPILDCNITGYSGCGICALWRLRDAGITHLKIVGRGNESEATVRDIKAMKLALSLLNEAGTEAEYIESVKKKLFYEGCSQNCYYPMENIE